MKRNIKFLTVVALMVAALTSCDSDASRLFGDIPKIMLERYAVMQQLQESGDADLYRDEGRRFDAEMEQAAEDISGKHINGIISEDFKIISPLALHFNKRSLRGGKIPRFTLTGDVEAAKDIVIETPSSYNRYDVFLDGYDSEGKICFCLNIGSVKCEYEDGKIAIKAGTPVEFGCYYLYDKSIYPFRYDAQGYLDARELKLVVHIGGFERRL